MSRRVAFVLAGLGAGGAERVISLLSGSMVMRGWSVTVISFDRPGAPVYHHFDPAIRFVSLGEEGGAPGLLRVVRRVRALRRALAVGEFDLIISFLTKMNVLTLFASSGRVPVIVSERNNPLRQRASPAWRWLLAGLYPRAAAIVLQTDRSRMCLPVGQRRRASVIANPISLPESLPTPAAQRITAVGRLTEQKGFDLLIEAFARVAADHPEWKLVIWGEGPQERALRERCRRLGLEGRVALPGLSATPAGWINPGQIFVLSSRYEGFPNVLGEAMAGGMAPIAFDCDFGPAEMIDHGRSGLLVRPEDVDALAEALRLLIQSRACREQLAREAVREAARWGVGQICEAWLAILESAGPRNVGADG